MATLDMEQLSSRDVPASLHGADFADPGDVLRDASVRVAEDRTALVTATDTHMHMIGVMHAASARILPGNEIIDVRPGNSSVPLPAGAEEIVFADDDQVLGAVRVDALRAAPMTVAAYAADDFFLPPGSDPEAPISEAMPTAPRNLHAAPPPQDDRLFPKATVTTQEPFKLTPHTPQQPWVDPLSVDPWRMLAAGASGPFLDDLLKYFEQRNGTGPAASDNVAPPPRVKIAPTPAKTDIAPEMPAPKTEMPMPKPETQPMQPPPQNQGEVEDGMLWAIGTDEAPVQAPSRSSTAAIEVSPAETPTDVQKLAVLGVLSVVIANPRNTGRMSLFQRLRRRAFANA